MAGASGVRVGFVTLPSGVTLRVAEAGPPAAPAVVLLHGWGASLFMHRFALRDLASAGLRAIAPDLRGHGLSDKPLAPGSYSLDAMLGDLFGLMDASGLGRGALVGQSMGGGLALHATLRAPERVSGLVLINPTNLTRNLPASVARSVPRFVVRALNPILATRRVARLVLRRVVYEDAALVTERGVDEYWAPTQFPEFAGALASAITEFDWSPIPIDRLRSVAGAPTLILGSRDRMIRGAAAVAAQLPGWDVVQIRGGHAVNEEHPDAVDPEIVRAVRGTPPVRG